MRWFLGLLLIGLVLASVWLRRPAPAEPPPARAAEGLREVDYYLRGLDVVTMDQDGHPARSLRGRELRHFADDGTSEVVSPSLTIHRGTEPPWELNAERGRVSADGELLELLGEVQLQRDAAPGVRPWALHTREVRVVPAQDYAETDEQVRVRSGRDWLDATGMQAWLRRPARIRFLSDVKGFYAPPE